MNTGSDAAQDGEKRGPFLATVLSVLDSCSFQFGLISEKKACEYFKAFLAE